MQELKTIRERKKRAALDEASKYTQDAIASAVGVSPPTYRCYEQNPGSAPLEVALRIAEYLGCSIDDFYLGTKRN